MRCLKGNFHKNLSGSTTYDSILYNFTNLCAYLWSKSGIKLLTYKRLWNGLLSGQSYKYFMLVNYDSRVVIWGIFLSGTTL